MGMTQKPNRPFTSLLARYGSLTLAVMVVASCMPEEDLDSTQQSLEERDFEHFPRTPERPLLKPLRTDPCDEPDYADVDWVTYQSTHFTFHYLPDTAAERDIEAIAGERERAYVDIQRWLGLSVSPRIDVYLSPNRVAATAHGVGTGAAYPSQRRYNVVYDGEPGSYERVSFGRQLAYVLAYYIDPSHPNRLWMLATGLAEYLDQSNRDFHRVYAEQLLSGGESRNYLAAFDPGDVQGRNHGRAASLVQLLVERYGIEDFLAIYRASYIEFLSGCYRHVKYGCINNEADLTRAIAGLVEDQTGESWDTVRAAWEQEIRDAMAKPSRLDDADRAEIANLVAVMDRAINTHDIKGYRSTLDGYYCDYGGEDERVAVATRVVASQRASTSEIVGIYPSGRKNFPTAKALVIRRDEHGVASDLDLSVEKLPIGWRVTWSRDWY